MKNKVGGGIGTNNKTMGVRLSMEFNKAVNLNRDSFVIPFINQSQAVVDLIDGKSAAYVTVKVLLKHAFNFILTSLFTLCSIILFGGSVWRLFDIRSLDLGYPGMVMAFLPATAMALYLNRCTVKLLDHVRLMNLKRILESYVTDKVKDTVEEDKNKYGSIKGHSVSYDGSVKEILINELIDLVYSSWKIRTKVDETLVSMKKTVTLHMKSSDPDLVRDEIFKVLEDDDKKLPQVAVDHIKMLVNDCHDSVKAELIQSDLGFEKNAESDSSGENNDT